MPAPPPACDVLVVGLGPVGLLLTALLRLHGCDAVAVERDLSPPSAPRAATLDDEALRTLQPVGAAGAVMRDGTVLSEAGLRLVDGRRVTLMRTPAQTVNRHPALVGLLQPDLEAKLGAVVGAAAHRGWQLTAAHDDGRGVDAHVRAGDGSERIVRAGWVVGCDGARSRVRALTGTPFAGTTFEQRWLVVDARVADRGPAHVTFIGDPAAPAVTLPLTAAVRRWEVMVAPGVEASAEATGRLIGPEAEPVRAAVYRFHARSAREWRTGRALLAGDAAHVMPPFAGQGLGAGLRDAANLAWKLAAVVGGRADERLLATYETERRGHVARMTALARFLGAIVQTRRSRLARVRDGALRATAATPVGAWLQAGAAKPAPRLGHGALLRASPGAGALLPQPLVRLAGEAPVPLDDAIGSGWALVARAPVPDAPQGVRRIVLGRDAEDVEGALGAWLEDHGAVAALVRPDRHVFGTAASVRAVPGLLARLEGIA